MTDRTSPETETFQDALEQARAYIEHDVDTQAPGWRTAQAIIELIDAALVRSRVAPRPDVPVDAIVNLTDYQQQCDMDGVMVQVSRQALCEVLLYVTEVRPDNKWASPDTSTDRACKCGAVCQDIGTGCRYSANNGKLRLFLSILQSAGGETSGNDDKWNWINYFCDDAEPLDTFNQASKRKLTRVTHDSDSDNSMVYLTDAGRAFIASPVSSPVRTKDATS